MGVPGNTSPEIISGKISGMGLFGGGPTHTPPNEPPPPSPEPYARVLERELATARAIEAKQESPHTNRKLFVEHKENHPTPELLPAAGSVLAAVQNEKFGTVWLGVGENYQKDDNDDGGTGFRHIYQRRISELEARRILSTPEELVEYVSLAASAKTYDSVKETDNRYIQKSLFEYNGSQLAAKVVIDKDTGEIRTVGQLSEKETQRLWRRKQRNEQN